MLLQISYQSEVAIKIEEQVLQITPTKSGRIKLLIVVPQMISRGIITRIVVSDVITDLPTVCLILSSTRGSRPFTDLFAELPVFSLILSKITIVSLIP